MLEGDVSRKRFFGDPQHALQTFQPKRRQTLGTQARARGNWGLSNLSLSRVKGQARAWSNLFCVESPCYLPAFRLISISSANFRAKIFAGTVQHISCTYIFALSSLRDNSYNLFCLHALGGGLGVTHRLEQPEGQVYGHWPWLWSQQGGFLSSSLSFSPP